MLYESEYYGVCSLGPSLMHHGIKGQKWGVRRTPEQLGHVTRKRQPKNRHDETNRHVVESYKKAMSHPSFRKISKMFHLEEIALREAPIQKQLHKDMARYFNKENQSPEEKAWREEFLKKAESPRERDKVYEEMKKYFDKDPTLMHKFAKEMYNFDLASADEHDYEMHEMIPQLYNIHLDYHMLSNKEKRKYSGENSK